MFKWIKEQYEFHSALSWDLYWMVLVIWMGYTNDLYEDVLGYITAPLYVLFTLPIIAIPTIYCLIMNPYQMPLFTFTLIKYKLTGDDD